MELENFQNGLLFIRIYRFLLRGNLKSCLSKLIFKNIIRANLKLNWNEDGVRSLELSFWINPCVNNQGFSLKGEFKDSYFLVELLFGMPWSI